MVERDRSMRIYAVESGLSDEALTIVDLRSIDCQQEKDI